MYYTYMMRCRDNSLYTGITTDIKRRYQEHLGKTDKAAKYTRRHPVLTIAAAWKSADRRLASQLEFQLKQLHKLEKEKIIIDDDLMEIFLGDKLNVKDYERADLKRLKLNEWQ